MGRKTLLQPLRQGDCDQLPVMLQITHPETRHEEFAVVLLSFDCTPAGANAYNGPFGSKNLRENNLEGKKGHLPTSCLNNLLYIL